MFRETLSAISFSFTFFFSSSISSFSFSFSFSNALFFFSAFAASFKASAFASAILLASSFFFLSMAACEARIEVLALYEQINIYNILFPILDNYVYDYFFVKRHFLNFFCSKDIREIVCIF